MVLDLLVAVLIFWLFSLIGLIAFLPFELALLFSLIVAVAGGVAGWNIQKIQKLKKQEHNQIWAMAKKCQEEIKELKTREDLTAYVASLLSQSPDFKDVCINHEGGKKKFKVDEGIAIKAMYRGFPLAIQCLWPVQPQERDGQERLILKLNKGLKEEEYKGALIVALGKIQPQLFWLIKKLKEKCCIAVLTEEKLVELAVQAKKQEGSLEKQKAANIKEAVLESKKGRKYLVGAFILWIICFIFKPEGYFGYIYMSFVFINLVLALICCLLGRKKERFDLEDLKLE